MIGWRSHKTSLVNCGKSRHPYQSTLPNPNYHKKHFLKEKEEHRRKPPIGKLCDYHNSSWHDTWWCKAQKTFLEIFLTSNLSDKYFVEFNIDASTLSALTSTTTTSLTFINEEEQEHLFHTHIWVPKIHFILLWTLVAKRTSFLNILWTNLVLSPLNIIILTISVEWRMDRN